MSKTRSSAEVLLMGKGTEELSGSHLLTNADAFRLLLVLSRPWYSSYVVDKDLTGNVKNWLWNW